MDDLILQKRSLEKRKKIANLISNFHIIVPSIGTFILFTGTKSKPWILTGCVILLYGLIFMLVGSFPLTKCISSIEKEIKDIDKSIRERRLVHASLDNLRNSMLFDEDAKYWEVIQKLDAKGFPHE